MSHPRLAPAATFVGFALVAAALQVLATLLLGVAPLEAIERAAAEGSRLYLVGALGTGIALAVLWILRRRPLLASGVFLAIELTVMLSIVTRTSRLGLAYHGEFILHHFTAFLAAAACISLGLQWHADPRFGKERFVAAAPAILSGGGLLLVHLAGQPGIEMAVPTQLQYGLVLLSVLAPAIALGALWRHLAATRVRILAIALLVPLLLRVASGFPESLTGGSVPDGARPLVMSAIVAAALVSFWAFRPDMPRPVRFVVMSMSAFITAIVYVLYVHPMGFGQFEDGVGGLAQSLLGFGLPYPTFTSGWKIVFGCLGLFCILSVVWGGLLSWNERVRGLALGLLAVTGIGLSNAPLTSMAIAALLLLVHTLAEPSGGAAQPAPSAPEDVLTAVARALSLDEPVVLETEEGAVVSLRGELRGAHVDVRARPLRGERAAQQWRVSLQIGVIGRGQPNVELAPDPSGAGRRPEHAIGQTHRVLGEPRSLEELDDRQLDALAPFTDATARFWDAGVDVELGRDLSALDGMRVSSLLEACARSCG